MYGTVVIGIRKKVTFHCFNRHLCTILNSLFKEEVSWLEYCIFSHLKAAFLLLSSRAGHYNNIFSSIIGGKAVCPSFD
jgi:hypothetical protein